MLQSNRKIHEACQVHFHDRFANFPYFQEAEAASCEGLVTKCEVRNALKQVSFNKWPGLDGLPYEVYLRMSHKFVPILTDEFNQWFDQGAIAGCITKGVITLLKKGGKHAWEELDDYKPITFLNIVKDFSSDLGEPLADYHQRSDLT